MAALLLAQMGAEVILAEPSGGHRSRHRGPYVGDKAGPEDALEFMAFNRGKQSVEVESTQDLLRLAASADAVIGSGVFAGEAALLDAMRDADPGLVTASISAYGGTGPKADWPATDLIIVAASGTMSLTGDRDRAPVRIGPPQAWLNAAADTAGAVLIALHERRSSGLGQHIDSSAQQSFADCSQFQLTAALVGAPIPQRLPGAVQLGEFLIPWVYECADGHVTITFLFGLMIGPFTSRLVGWLHEEGFVDDSVRDRDWADFGMAIYEGRETIDVFDDAVQALRAFALTKTKAELLERALADNLLIAPVTTTADVMALGQLAERDYWEHVEVGAAGAASVRFPGALAKFSERPRPPLAPAPALGASTSSVTTREPAALARGTAPDRALDDVKVVDFMWAMAGPGATRVLADHGATVVKIESESKPDVLRGVNPFIGEDGGQENALQFHSLNAGKLDLTLDLSTSEARDVVFDLVRWADVLTESFSPKAMANWGFSYEDLRKVNPELVMFSSCLMGQTGSMRMYAGFGTMAAAIAGFYPITGWPDRIPAGPFTAYTDYISPRLSVVTIMAALAERARTGTGQHIDFAQLEGALHFLAPELLDEEINGRTVGRHGNADREMVPHGVYPATGDDRWVAIACETEANWRALACLIGAEALADLGPDERRARAEEIDALVAAWTSAQDRMTAQDQLIASGIPAHAVSDAADTVADPQLTHRSHYLQAPHPKHGMTWVENGNYTLSRTPSRVDWGGPTFGQHNMEVLEGILGYDGERIAELVIAGAIS
ncbi:MAG: crotonobetainyl-CoA:carnitine CoA-transferase CaiB-like acyl-CoA transferase [Candidatus Poriferisodalaceae bacterium]|jgi:crotonobetainyl-CoA:carnitine CoA-transferase CaiB-like acyl-CoA transferase